MLRNVENETAGIGFTLDNQDSRNITAVNFVFSDENHLIMRGILAGDEEKFPVRVPVEVTSVVITPLRDMPDSIPDAYENGESLEIDILEYCVKRSSYS